MGNNGLPVARSNRKRNPCLLVCATASTRLPLRFTVTSAGGEGKSRSQMSVMYALEVPDALSGLRIQSQQRIRK